MPWPAHPRAFVTPFAVPWYARNTPRLLLPRQHHELHGCPVLHSRTSCCRWRKSRRTMAVQARPVSGDSDGEFREQVSVTPQKSFSVGITIVSAFDPHLRRSVVERIVADADVGRIAVVTMGGITSTEETDGPVSSKNPALDSNASRTKHPINGAKKSVAGNESESDTANTAAVAAAVNNLEGWISCVRVDEMVEVLLKLASSREWDYIIAECAVNAAIEPQDLAQVLYQRGNTSLRVDTLVSVLDSDTLLQDLASLPVSSPPSEATDEPLPTESTPPHQIHDSTQQRPMVVVGLVENSNIVVIKQSEDDRPERISRAYEVVSVLNGNASIVPATDGMVPVDLLINTNMYNNDIVRISATWKKVLFASKSVQTGSKPYLPKAVKDTTFLYQARRPFHPARLYEHFKDVATFEGVIRSTGRIWLATRMIAPLEWNQAGVAATLRVGNPFLASTPESEWDVSDEDKEKIREKWDALYGDRETEIVFVGIGIDKVRLQGLLDGCLLQDEEMIFNTAWENLEDPFVEWVPLIEEDEDSDDEEASWNKDGDVTSVASTSAASNDTIPNVVEEKEDLPTAGKDINDGSDGTGNVEVETNIEAQEKVEPVKEGAIDADELPDEMFDELTALDIFQEGFASESDLKAQPEDDELFDKEDAVIASWDGSVADGILTQIPQTGLPVTILTGFLGSGKTTLLNYILTADHGLKIAVLVNEFGEIDIDSQLIQKGDWDSGEVLELSNGCICCDINDSFISAVEKILERKDSVDYLVIETTGVADPKPVVNSLMMTEIAEHVRLDGVITLVDAENFLKTSENSEVAVRQIVAADTILLSKTDVASSKDVDKVIEFIQSVRPAARILKSRRGRVPIDLILDVGLRIADSPSHSDPSPTKKDEVSHSEDSESELLEAAHAHEHGQEHEHMHDHEHDHEHGHDHDHDHDCGPDCTDESHSHNHLEADGFVTTSFKSDRPLDTRLFMDKFLRTLPEGVFRAKGLLYFQGFGERYVFQLSGRRYHLQMDDWPADVAPGNQLVIIGRDLDLELLRETLDGCHAVTNE